MSTNAELARIFSEMAAVMEITGDNPFKINSHLKVARVIGDLTFDLATIANDKSRLLAIDGIGEGTAKRIMEYAQTGRVREHDELVASVPPGLLQVTKVPGIGPKTARLLWEKCGVTDLQSLKEKIECGALVGIPRMGEKTIQNILQSIEFVEKASERTLLGQALPIAENLIEYLKQTKGVKKLEYAGSLRRGLETIGDVDLLASTSDPEGLTEVFTTMSMVKQVLAKGETKSSVRLINGMQVDLRIVPDDCFGAALLYFTGSKAHNIALRERAQKQQLTLNEYGLFPDDGKPRPQERSKPTAAKTEESIYKALKLPWIPPELREDAGEFDRDIPELITLEDIKAELHAHTVASDGRLTVEQLIEEAQSRGFHTIAITDHSRSSVQANGLQPDRLLRHIEDVRNAASKYQKMNVLAGSEVDIHIDGCLDYEDEILAQLDIVVASPHASLKQEPEKATARILCAIRHPLVHIIGHPTGRMLKRREGLFPDIHKLIEAAVEHNVALEINANPWRLDLRDTNVRAAVTAGALIAINTDAHTYDDFDNLRYGVLTARRGWLTAPQCVNTWSSAKLMKWLRSKR